MHFNTTMNGPDFITFIQSVFRLDSHISGLCQATSVTRDSWVNQYFWLITHEVLRGSLCYRSPQKSIPLTRSTIQVQLQDLDKYSCDSPQKKIWILKFEFHFLLTINILKSSLPFFRTVTTLQSRVHSPDNLSTVGNLSSCTVKYMNSSLLLL